MQCGCGGADRAGGLERYGRLLPAPASCGLCCQGATTMPWTYKRIASFPAHRLFVCLFVCLLPCPLPPAGLFVCLFAGLLPACLSAFFFCQGAMTMSTKVVLPPLGQVRVPHSMFW